MIQLMKFLYFFPYYSRRVKFLKLESNKEETVLKVRKLTHHRHRYVDLEVKIPKATSSRKFGHTEEEAIVNLW
jgi:hypothetical protein